MEKGALRKQVLWTVQEHGPIGLSDVCAILRERREISATAVQTVLNRLVAQGYLVRTGSRRRYLYQAHLSEAMEKQNAAQAAMDLLSQSEGLGWAHFVETIDQVRPEALEKLERLLHDRRTKGKPS